MVVSLDENLLLGASVAIFVPLFIFFVKLIIEIGGIKNSLQSMNDQIDDYKQTAGYVNDVRYDIRDIKRRLSEMESDFRHSKGTGTSERGSPM